MSLLAVNFDLSAEEASESLALFKKARQTHQLILVDGLSCFLLLFTFWQYNAAMILFRSLRTLSPRQISQQLILHYVEREVISIVTQSPKSLHHG